MVKSKNDVVFNIVVYLILILVGLVCLVPILYVVSASFTSTTALRAAGGFTLIPRDITFTAYKQLVADGALTTSMWFTIKLTVIGTLSNLLATTLAAYPLSRKQLPGNTLFMKLIVFTMVFSAGIVPTYLVVKATGLLNTMAALYIPSLISAYNMVIMKSFFEGLPEELFESARIDGATEATVLVKIVLPMSLPIMMTIGLYYAVNHWNCYMQSVYYITKNELRPLQVILRRLLESAKNDIYAEEIVPQETMQMAAVCFATAPIVIIYPFIQKYFVKGTLAGAVKG